MRGEAMENICRRLQNSGEPLSAYSALEFFAREGEWQTKSYAHLVKELHLWELDPIYENALKINFPQGHIRIGDSFKLAQEPQYRQRFNWLVLDNPQMIYGDYCEHFEALNLAAVLMASVGVLIFNVNKKPFNYDRHTDWQDRRRAYYGCNAAHLATSFLLDFYRKRIEKLGFNVRYMYEEPRNTEYLSYIVAGVSRPDPA